MDGELGGRRIKFPFSGTRMLVTDYTPEECQVKISDLLIGGFRAKDLRLAHYRRHLTPDGLLLKPTRPQSQGYGYMATVECAISSNGKRTLVVLEGQPCINAGFIALLLIWSMFFIPGFFILALLVTLQYFSNGHVNFIDLVIFITVAIGFCFMSLLDLWFWWISKKSRVLVFDTLQKALSAEELPADFDRAVAGFAATSDA